MDSYFEHMRNPLPMDADFIRMRGLGRSSPWDESSSLSLPAKRSTEGSSFIFPASPGSPTMAIEKSAPLDEVELCPNETMENLILPDSHSLRPDGDSRVTGVGSSPGDHGKSLSRSSSFLDLDPERTHAIDRLPLLGKTGLKPGSGGWFGVPPDAKRRGMAIPVSSTDMARSTTASSDSKHLAQDIGESRTTFPRLRARAMPVRRPPGSMRQLRKTPSLFQSAFTASSCPSLAKWIMGPVPQGVKSPVYKCGQLVCSIEGTQFASKTCWGVVAGSLVFLWTSDLIWSLFSTEDLKQVQEHPLVTILPQATSRRLDGCDILTSQLPPPDFAISTTEALATLDEEEDSATFSFVSFVALSGVMADASPVSRSRTVGDLILRELSSKAAGEDVGLSDSKSKKLFDKVRTVRQSIRLSGGRHESLFGKHSRKRESSGEFEPTPEPSTKRYSLTFRADSLAELEMWVAAINLSSAYKTAGIPSWWVKMDPERRSLNYLSRVASRFMEKTVQSCQELQRQDPPERQRVSWSNPFGFELEPTTRFVLAFSFENRWKGEPEIPPIWWTSYCLEGVQIFYVDTDASETNTELMSAMAGESLGVPATSLRGIISRKTLDYKSEVSKCHDTIQTLSYQRNQLCDISGMIIIHEMVAGRGQGAVLPSVGFALAAASRKALHKLERLARDQSSIQREIQRLSLLATRLETHLDVLRATSTSRNVGNMARSVIDGRSSNTDLSSCHH